MAASASQEERSKNVMKSVSVRQLINHKNLSVLIEVAKSKETMGLQIEDQMSCSSNISAMTPVFQVLVHLLYERPLLAILQVIFTAVAPLDRQEECAISLTGETRKLTVVGNIPELGEWSLKRGITLKQLKSGQSLYAIFLLQESSEDATAGFKSPSHVFAVVRSQHKPIRT